MVAAQLLGPMVFQRFFGFLVFNGWKPFVQRCDGNNTLLQSSSEAFLPLYIKEKKLLQDQEDQEDQEHQKRQEDQEGQQDQQIQGEQEYQEDQEYQEIQEDQEDQEDQEVQQN